MTSEIAESSCHAVRCLYCSEPIPLSASLLRRLVVKSDSATAPEDSCLVFTLRCEACSKERRYCKAEIAVIELLPVKTDYGRPPGPKGYSRLLFSEAAGQ
jgi:hypothetical protein